MIALFAARRRRRLDAGDFGIQVDPRAETAMMDNPQLS